MHRSGVCAPAAQVLAQLPPASARQSSAILSSIEFDRDSEFFATAGVSKRISIFNFADVLDKPYVDVHAPALEISTRSKLSCVAWHKYVKSHLISSDYEGAHALKPKPFALEACCVGAVCGMAKVCVRTSSAADTRVRLM